MFPEVYRKFYTYLVLSFVLALGATGAIYGGEGVTAYVVSDSTAFAPGFNWGIFFAGIFIGGLIVATVIYFVHHETKRL